MSHFLYNIVKKHTIKNPTSLIHNHSLNYRWRNFVCHTYKHRQLPLAKPEFELSIRLIFKNYIVSSLKFWFNVCYDHTQRQNHIKDSKQWKQFLLLYIKHCMWCYFLHYAVHLCIPIKLANRKII